MEACGRPGQHGHCRGLMTNRSLLSLGQSSTEISASHRYPACAGAVQRLCQKAATPVRYPLTGRLTDGRLSDGRRRRGICCPRAFVLNDHFPRRYWSALKAVQTCSNRHGRHADCLARNRWNHQKIQPPVRQSWELRQCQSSNFRRRCRQYRGDQLGRGRHACQSLRCPGFLKTRPRLPVPRRAEHAASGHGTTPVQPAADVW